MKNLFVTFNYVDRHACKGIGNASMVCDSLINNMLDVHELEDTIIKEHNGNLTNVVITNVVRFPI